MFRRMRYALAILACAYSCHAQSTDPVGPAGWTVRNWIGFCLQITVFILAVIGICKLGCEGRNDTQDETASKR